jgi:hypothetical protein
MVEADAGRGPLLATPFENDLSHHGVCQDTQVRAIRIGQVVRGSGIRACGSPRVDSHHIRPHTDIRSGQVGFVRLEAQCVEGLVPVRVRLGILWQIGDVERTVDSHGITSVVDLMLLLLCGIERLDKVLGFLVERSSRISGSLRVSCCGTQLTACHPIPILCCPASPTHPGPPDSACSRS